LNGLITRRTFLKAVLASGLVGTSMGGYALAEPYRLRVTRYAVRPNGWPARLKLRLAVIADLHCVEPFVSLERVGQVVARTNALQADAILLLGDFVVSHRIRKFAAMIPGGRVPDYDEYVGLLAGLKAPLGVHAVLGNHDWWDDDAVQRRRAGPVPVALSLRRHGIPVLENDAVRLENSGQGFWLAGLGDQWAFYPRKWDRTTKIPYEGVHDVEATLEKVDDDAPVVLMAHEPDIFATLSDRVALTVSGHTHGGQVRLLGYAPIVPSRFGQRYVYGHMIEDGRHLVVSGGLGCSGLPLRFGSPPEVVVIDVAGEVAGGIKSG